MVRSARVAAAMATGPVVPMAHHVHGPNHAMKLTPVSPDLCRGLSGDRGRRLLASRLNSPRVRTYGHWFQIIPTPSMEMEPAEPDRQIIAIGGDTG